MRTRFLDRCVTLVLLAGAFVTRAQSTRNSSPNATVSGTSAFIPGLVLPITAYGAKCDWNGTTGTDDTAAFLAAWAAVLAPGGMIDLPARACYVPNGLNLSTRATVTSSGTRGFKGRGASSQIVTRNANIGMDFGGVSNVVLEDFMLTDVGTKPQVGIARYRTLVGGSYQGGGSHIYKNITILGRYALSDLYSIASEVNNHYNLIVHSYGSGSGLTIAQSNCLNMTGQGQPIYPNSDTVNHFFGGMFTASVSGQTGGAALFCNGSADDVSFYGTYFAGVSTGYDVRMGQSATDSVQGSKNFHAVRFEGTADALSFVASDVGSLTIDSGSTFGEMAPGIDLNWLSPVGSYAPQGLYLADIHGNNHLGRGMVLQDVADSHIWASTTYNVSTSYPATNITLNADVSDSSIEANTFTFGSGYYDNGAVLITNDDETATGGLKVIYGPHSPGVGYPGTGSVVVMQPFSSAPANPIIGELATADGINWKPDGVTSQTLMQWTGTAWVPACR